MHYQKTRKLSGHADSINTFAFNLDGSRLASGGDDQKVIIWCMEQWSAVQELHDISWGQITTIIWLGIDAEGRESIVFGCGRGMLHLYSQNKAGASFVERGSVAAHSRTSVEALTFDAPGRRLASSSAHGDVCLWAITEEGSFNLLWATRISERHEGTRGLVFSEDHTLLHVFCTETGYVHGLDVEHGGERRKTWQARSRMCDRHFQLCYSISRTSSGSVSSASTKRLVLVDNLDKGFTLYRFPTMGLVRHFSAPSSLPWLLIKHVVFAESDTLVVGGSDNGKVHVFDLPSSRTVQVLSHGRCKDAIQAIAAFSYENRHVISPSYRKPHSVLTILCATTLVLLACFLGSIMFAEFSSKHPMQLPLHRKSFHSFDQYLSMPYHEDSQYSVDSDGLD
ncbi:WD40 repeat-like protein [Sistotremastrum suecicum HHB10207 ss-3]|uniref:WD40 repeat-like protein n=1 Tax=Sistotremastrum suecicum HHB10207 ss-3 TaxID=1314776 RepID=A0A165WXG1_9AGAM|nr:WD40 repeat-like protein [Sistotremastrum suecicum HHB10207 ss-3]